ncbi:MULTISPECIES: response regulator transcription factor [unclassified Clostridioides]|uniref:response regulator transcription factor n=1 Tax=unclassified Clostridioides TaxID=2635829 RepID=UPI001D0C9DD0|nr:response regulator transcription factor [Clostridioides sp. ES-S-0049-03]MCC0651117.1 response regulator transcription factor [Clostridioides sp. ES-S-0001-03]MCC0677384.1 response regulator transcription factor [Clostridioides sp. ES-W-0018-02]MCC0702701.1 response regulator transcription factor [Clostridioides sp. ES-S-0049-02]MCC0709172.1 response regulator transcription factor [Clostridioides sp. ES-S-0190-01]MCC0712532.1 response regulator transcription factor [Clostridioides sp. ES-W-
METIMVVEDDIMLNNGICFNLQSDGFRVVPTYSLKEAKEKFEKEKIDLMILDVNLPDGNGFDLCKEIRASSKVGILFLTACDMESDIVNGFKIGADDYITKPFSINILIQRIKALLRRCNVEIQEEVLFEGEFEFNFDNMIVTRNSENIILSPIEYRILKKLVQHKNEIVTRQALIDAIWDNDSEYMEEHALTVNINRLRKRIDQKTSKHKYIRTIYGIGYMWVGEQDEK